MLLNHGGELGFHGYNHMPLCLENFDYKGLYDGYTLWKSTEDMEKAVTELGEFSSEIFPQQKFSIYVPPSNILSQEGRKALKESMPDISVQLHRPICRVTAYTNRSTELVRTD